MESCCQIRTYAKNHVNDCHFIMTLLSIHTKKFLKVSVCPKIQWISLFVFSVLYSFLECKKIFRSSTLKMENTSQVLFLFNCDDMQNRSTKIDQLSFMICRNMLTLANLFYVVYKIICRERYIYCIWNQVHFLWWKKGIQVPKNKQQKVGAVHFYRNQQRFLRRPKVRKG